MSSRSRHVGLWIAQCLLALLFLFAGIMKLTMPAQALALQTGLPGWFMRFISAAEIAGALGLVLPGLLRVRRGLTPLAAGGLIVIMVGATVLSLVRIGPSAAVMPFAVGIVLSLIVLGRRDWTRGTGPRTVPVDPVVDFATNV
jgi:uncharacterized membrane protein YphA (DoxX/SURF4 family)